MRLWSGLAAAALLTLAAAAAGASAASRPSFARSYRGTITGSLRSTSGGDTVNAHWKITGLVFRLTRVQAFEGGFTGLYKVTRGTVSYSESETGSCSYTGSLSFALMSSLPHPNPSVPLALDQDPLGRKTMLGLINVTRKLDVTESCPQDDGSPPLTSTRKLPLPTLFDPGETPWRPGRKLHHRRSERSGDEQRTWAWSLKPGR